jgi:predicted nucleic-acid-binding Zn-ribbon protein
MTDSEKGPLEAAHDCPSCHANKWSGFEDVVELPVQGPGTDRYGTGARYPSLEVIAATCHQCGYVLILDRRWRDLP